MADDIAPVQASASRTNDLDRLLPPGTWSTEPDLIALMSADIWAEGHPAVGVFSPGTTQELAAGLRVLTAQGLAVNPRGGGMSYTGAYPPDRPGVVILDTARMDQVLEVNREDMFVTVQAGCTWKTLHETLKPLGVRTPFWGPLSGISSTVGGGLSQNNAFFGAGTHGTTGESCLSLAVVLPDGRVLRTGSAAAAGVEGGASPFFRHYGPDLTGLFLGDGGAIGVKAEATLRLIPAPEHEDWASFEFTTRDACAQAMAAIQRENLACELFGFDPELSRLRMKRASLLADAKALANVVTGQGNLFKGLAEGARVALAGRQFMADVAWSLHMVVEGRSRAGVAEDMGRLKRHAVAAGGREIENSIPKIIRANPFTPLNNVLGPGGERWVPVHGIVPVSKGPAVWAEIEAAFDRLRPEFEANGVQTGYLITSVGVTGYLIEPVFLWPEARHALHEATVEASWLRRLDTHAPNPAATEVVTRARAEVVAIFARHGGVHFQIGRTYPWLATRSAEFREVVEGIKRLLDPTGQINPGALGLNRSGERA